MSRASEQWSKASATSQGRTDANLANDSNNLGGIPAGDWATKQWVREYHDGKESDLGKYVDEQDQKMLDEAKEYANSLVRNQDFSGFAEIKDLQALNANLTEQITEGLTEQKNYTDSKTQQIVTDVNANFQDVENSISTLNGTVNDLFQSVSNGKGVIAEAITDKGVPTSATDSYSTMATNIRSIKTAGDVEIDPNFVNTSDGNATESDIRLGKVAYVKGQKVYGALVVEEGGGSGTGGEGGEGEDNPNKGIDTSDATATAADIAYGKTAYARGQKLTGTLVNTQVEEIYGIDAEGATVSNFSGPLTTDPVTQEELGDNFTAYYSKNLDYAVVNYPDKRYVYSHPIGENGIYIMATTSMGGESSYKKYKYTYSELGIPDDETIFNVAFGASGVNNDSHVCYLFILTKKFISAESSQSNYDICLYVKTYHLRENGVIGQEYDGEEILDYKYYPLKSNVSAYTWDNPDMRIIPCNLKIGKFFYLYNIGGYSAYIQSGEVTTIWQGEGQQYSGSVMMSSTENGNGSIDFLEISQDDRHIFSANGKTYSLYVDIDPDDDYNFTLGTTGNRDFRSGNNYTYDSQKKLFIDNGGNIYTSLKTNRDKGIILDIPEENYLSAFISKVYSIGNSIVCIYCLNAGPTKMAIFNGDIASLADGTHLTPEITYEILSFSDYGDNLNYYSDINTSKIFVFYETSFSSYYRQITFGVDSSNIVAVKYRDKIFYSVKEGILTAGTDDVRKGKTFIGRTGNVMEGTMEVTE